MTSHSEQFIAEMKQILLQEKADLEQDIKAEANPPEYGRDDEDNATEIADYTATSSIMETKQVRLKEVVAALERIDAGTYGLTEDGKTIPEKRLRANPAATTTVT